MPVGNLSLCWRCRISCTRPVCCNERNCSYTVYFNRMDDVQSLCVEVMESFYQKDGSTEWELIWEGTHDEMMEEYGRGAA